MADISGITGYSIHSPFSDFGGNAGPSSTTTGVGGVGAYHRRHQQNKAAGLQDSTDSSASPPNQENDLLAPIGLSNLTVGSSLSSSITDNHPPILTDGNQTTLAAWLAENDSQSHLLGSPGQLLDTLV